MERYRANRACSCTRCRCRGITWPVLLVTAGVLFLLDNFHVVGFQNSWPLLLIAVGAALVLQRTAPMHDHTDANLPPNWPGPQAPGPDESEARNA
jgi:hypothetical protein